MPFSENLRPAGVVVPLVTCGVLLLTVAACAPQDPAPAPPIDPPAADQPALTAAGAENPSPADAAEPLGLRFVSPNIGPTAGGNDVTIDGWGFAAYPRISFGGVPAWIRSVTPAEVRVTVPAPAEPVAAGATLTVDVTVTNPPQGAEDPASETLTRSYSYVDASAGDSTVAGSPSPPPETAPPAETATPAEPAATGAPSAEPDRPPSLVAHFGYDIVADSEHCPSPDTGVRFIDRSTGGVTEWWWDFGDGHKSREQHVEHCYSAPGMRSVTLIVTNAEESATTSEIVTVGME